MALWRRRLKQQVLIHSDQGCQFTGDEWEALLRDHNLLCGMSQRVDCHDDAVAGGFSQLLQRDRIHRHYVTRRAARAEVFDYIEMLYNPTERHSTAAGMSPVELEQRHSLWVAAA